MHYSDWDMQTILMKRFSLLKSFKLTGECPRRSWNTIPEELRSELNRIFASPDLTTIALSQFRCLPVVTFAHCHHVLRLKLANLHILFTPRSGIEKDIRNPVPKPTILYLERNDMFALTRLFKAKWSDSTPIMDFSSIHILHEHHAEMMIPDFLHQWKPNIDILAISGELLCPI